MRLLASLCAGLAVALVLAQAEAAKPRSRGKAKADAGESPDKPVYLGTDPPGRLRASVPPPDAGVRAAADAGPDDLHRELSALRARVDLLERDRAAAHASSQRLDQLAAELAALKGQLGDAEARKQTTEADRAAGQEQVTAALGGLATAQQRLAEGDSAVDAELEQAEATLTGEALRDVQLAREALRNRDLSQARAWLSAATRATQQTR